MEPWVPLLSDGGKRFFPLVSGKFGGDDTAAILQWANQRLGKTQRLAGLRVVSELPRSPIGKILKRELRDRLAGSQSR